MLDDINFELGFIECLLIDQVTVMHELAIKPSGFPSTQNVTHDLPRGHCFMFSRAPLRVTLTKSVCPCVKFLVLPSVFISRLLFIDTSNVDFLDLCASCLSDTLS